MSKKISSMTPLSDGGDGRIVVVGLKSDSQSRELLTWSLVKMAQPGDLVVALHVLGSNEIVCQDGKSSLLSLVKAFDCVLAVYEGFCNLKQVDLKLKICRGPSIRKIIVREAKAYCANAVILGTANKRHAMRSSASLAKYCARKLSRDCSIIAVNDGKVAFQREAYSTMERNSYLQGTVDHQRNSLLSVLNKSLETSCKRSDDDYNNVDAKVEPDKGSRQTLEQALAKPDTDSTDIVPPQICTVCDLVSVDTAGSSDQVRKDPDSSSNDHEDNPMAIVSHRQSEIASSSISLLVRKLPEASPGWPLLRRALFPGRKCSDQSSSVRQSSVLQWAMPSRHCFHYGDSSPAETECDEHGDFVPSDLDGESVAIVLLGSETVYSQDYSLHYSPSSLPAELKGVHEKYSSACRLFKYHELQSATSNFAHENLIGRGGSSKVYRGTLPDGNEMAVKILKQSEDVIRVFVLEIEIVTYLHHKNIISLIGFCFENDNLILVYDLLPRGSLEENLHGDKKNPIAFRWSERYKVAIGLAKALHYLHNLMDCPVIHRDVKSPNILLSDDFEPQLSDFGLAKWLSTSASHTTCTDVAGTFGYLAPEYFMHGKVTDKIDVYAYGVVLLELLSGRKPISSDHPKGQESLVMWAKPFLNGGNVSQLLDPCISRKYNHEQMERMVLAATLCIRRAPQARPQMNLVLKLLQGDADVMKWARLQVNVSENADRLDGEGFTCPSIQSHLNLALHDIEDESLSVSSIEQHMSLEDYLTGRWSRSSSFD